MPASLVFLRGPLYTHKIYPWMKTSPSQKLNKLNAFQSIADPLNYSSIRTKTVLVASAKGFGGAVPVSNRKPSTQGDASRGSGGGDGDEDEIPQDVFNRIVARILFFVGAPIGLGVILLNVFSTLKDHHVWDVPLWLPYITIVLGFGTSALGIAYGALSTSWNPDRKGSLLGWEEAQKNWPELWKEEEEMNR